MTDNKTERHYPVIEDATNILSKACHTKMTELYGSNLPEEISRRAADELKAIIDYQNESIYLIAKQLVEEARRVGQPTGFNGTIGSSFVAFLLGITDSNPLRPHYYCRKCKHIEFITTVRSGYDLPSKTCPNCYGAMSGDGQNIPFESIGGLNGEKKLDIVLNFTSEFRTSAKEILIPNSNIVCTDSISQLTDSCYKLASLINVSLDSIPMNDPKVYKAFRDGNTNTIPEFGTNFVKTMIEICKPNNFSDLIKVSNLSHGTDAWINNADMLLQNGTATLQEVIASGEDIFDLLISKGMVRECAYEIMKTVRMGKGSALPDNLFDAYGLPEWYIDSCRVIKYLFPKSHAVNRAKIAVQMMWLKLNYSEAYNKLISMGQNRD